VPRKRDIDPLASTITEVEGPPRKDALPHGACLVVIYGTDLGRRMTLGRSAFTIGRSSKCDLFLDQDSVSRHHAKVISSSRHYSIVDQRSKNGTYVNDHPVTEKALKDGDQIKIGRSILKFMTGSNVEQSYHEEIYRLMTIDGLTQVYNRRYFNEVLEREYKRAARYGRTLSLMIIDIDHFKRVNDAHGHVAGDSVLRQLATAVKAKLREQDVFARVGGEEFGILLPEVDLEGARAAAEKVRAIAETSGATFEERMIKCTVSVGIASCAAEAGDDGATALYAAADAAMVRAKKRGRNRVEG
jgi:diguanylate cyclase (GGDEF)-like protein